MGSYSESIAISTDSIVAPEFLTYNDDDTDCSTVPAVTGNNLDFALFVYQTETPCYQGSQGTFSISPALPSGLSIDSVTGVISGIPTYTDDVDNAYIITIVNYKGSLSTPISLDVSNLAPANLAYTAADATENIILTEGDSVDDTVFVYTSDFDNRTAGRIVTYTELSVPPNDLASMNLALNTATGEVTDTGGTGATATDPLELTPTAQVITIEGNNDVGPAITDTVSVLVNEQALAFSYGLSGANSFFIKGDESGTGDIITGAAAHTGGVIAQTNVGAGPLPACGALNTGNDFICAVYVSNSNGVTKANADLLLLETTTPGTTGLTLDNVTGDIDYNGSICPGDVLNNGGNNTITYDITAYNSGSPTGVTQRVSLEFYNTPNYIFAPGAHNLGAELLTAPMDYTNDVTPNPLHVFINDKKLALDGTFAGGVNPLDRYGAYRADLCHEGSFTITGTSALPTEIAFDAADGTFAVSSLSLIGRRTYALSATETISGHGYSQSEDISVQVNHIEANAGDIDATLRTEVVDFNGDSVEDLIIINEQCTNDGTCGNGNVTLYYGEPGRLGVYKNIAMTTPIVPGITSIASIQYSATDFGLIYTNNDAGTYRINTFSITESGIALNSTSAADTTITFANPASGVVPMQGSGVVTSLGVVTLDAAADQVIMQQYTINGSKISDLDDQGAGDGLDVATTATITVVDEATDSLGMDVDSIQKVAYHPLATGTRNSAAIAYLDSDLLNRRLCLLSNNGIDFGSTCAAKINLSTTADVKDIIFADVAGDSLSDIIILLSSGTSNDVYIYENKSNIVADFYEMVDILNLKSTSNLVDITLRDLNNDGRIDILSNDVESDVGTDAANDFITGYTIYYHSGASDIYQSALSSTNDPSLNPNPFFYPNSFGSANHVQIIDSLGVNLFLHCTIDAGHTLSVGDAAVIIPATDNSSCGIIGNF